MIAKCAVTFEFEMRAPLTWRGEVEATNVWTIVGRATRLAVKELRPRSWSSVVCVILERAGDEDTSSEESNKDMDAAV